MDTRVRNIKIFTIFVTILLFTTLCHSPGRSDTSFYWPMFIPAITGVEGCNIGPFWNAYTTVCCQNSSLTFSVTISGKTKRSTAMTCTTSPTLEDWTETSPGTKSVSWQITSQACGTYSGNFPWIMDKGKSYGYQLELVEGDLKIFVYTIDACSVFQNAAAIKSPQPVEEIWLDVPPDAFSQNSRPVNSFQTVD